MDKKAEMFKLTNAVKIQNVCFVDPGLGGTGLAYFEQIITRGEAKRKRPLPPRTTKQFNGGRKESWEMQVCNIAASCGGFWSATGSKTVVIEMPRLFAGDAKSMASAKKGDLFKLSYLVGALALQAKQITGNVAVLVEPAEWKGQLPKDVMLRRMVRVWPALGVTSHVADACGIGLAAQGGL